MVVLLAEAGPGPRALSGTTQAQMGLTQHVVGSEACGQCSVGVGSAHVSDIVCDVIPHDTTAVIWDSKSLCVTGLCATELGTL